MSPAAQDDLVRVARIGKPHGIRGEVTVQVFTDDPDARFAPGERLGIIGESGSGKSLTALAIMGLSELPTQGRVLIDATEMLHSPDRVTRAVRGSKVGMVFQEPMTALDPLKKVGKLVPRELLQEVGVDRPDAYPHQLSGGQRQRVLIALALSQNPDYLICDEAQFYTRDQVDQLAKVVDELQLDVFVFGILTDFRSELFPGSARLVELADHTHVLQVEALCWCGKRATHNARVVDGTMVVEGEQVVVGDTGDQGETPLVEYEVLCRRHFMRRMTSHAARTIGAQQMPFDLDVCPVPASTFVASEPAGESSTAHEGP